MAADTGDTDGETRPTLFAPGPNEYTPRNVKRTWNLHDMKRGNAYDCKKRNKRRKADRQTALSATKEEEEEVSKRSPDA